MSVKRVLGFSSSGGLSWPLSKMALQHMPPYALSSSCLATGAVFFPSAPPQRRPLRHHGELCRRGFPEPCPGLKPCVHPATLRRPLFGPPRRGEALSSRSLGFSSRVAGGTKRRQLPVQNRLENTTGGCSRHPPRAVDAVSTVKESAPKNHGYGQLL